MTTTKKAVPAKVVTMTPEHESDLNIMLRALKKASDDYDLCDAYYDVMSKLDKTLGGRLTQVNPEAFHKQRTLRFECDVDFTLLKGDALTVAARRAMHADIINAIKAAGMEVSWSNSYEV